MKRDLGIVREFLLEIEAVPAGHLYDLGRSEYRNKFPGLNHSEVREYFSLIREAGFLSGATMAKGVSACRGLSWEGHDFLDSIRSEKVWSAVSKKVSETGITVAWSVVKTLANKVAMEYLGIKAD